MQKDFPQTLEALQELEKIVIEAKTKQKDNALKLDEIIAKIKDAL